MFVLHTSNRAENLIEHLVKILEAPQKDVFAKEVFLIQSQGMERWLSQQLAEKRGLWANFEYLFPARFFSDMSQKLGLSLQQDAFGREVLLWRFESLLRDIDNPALQPLAKYLKGDSQERKRYQLAQQLAYLFDQYMFMRPDWLEAWQQNALIKSPQKNEVAVSTELWQSALWRQLIESLDPEASKHRGQCWLEAIHELKTRRVGDFKDLLPERISVLGINTLSPMYLGYLQALSRHIQVHFYLLNPCQEFWAESNKAVKAQLNQQSTQHFSVNMPDDLPINPLLGMLGQQGRDFQVLLLEQQANEIEISSFDGTEVTGDVSLLAQLQNDILLNRAGDAAFELAENDLSLTIHACHTRMREIEVLKDQLTACFDTDEALDLRDVVVMAPDIQLYLPYIDAVFDDIPYAVADRSLRQTNQLLDILLRFSELSQSRLIWHEVLAILEEPVVRERFGLFEADMLIVKHWVEVTRIRWGESAAHRDELGVGGFSENSWEAGLERLLMGYAVPTDDEFSDGILPYSDIEGSQAQVLGGFHAFYKLLKKARRTFSNDRTLSEWLALIRDYSAQLLTENNDLKDQWSGLRELFESLEESSQIHSQTITLDVFSDHLKSMADEQKTATGFMRGQLTFCSMLPMRAIPFSTIALLGMNEGEFPNVDGRAAFDLMDMEFRRGDRSRRADERYQFLEILVSSRKQILISYLGRSIKNNDEIPPSVVVSELLDTLQQYYQLPQEKLLTKHPLQAFHPRYFLPDSDLFSYSKTAADVATALQKNQLGKHDFWWQGELQEPDTPDDDMLVDLEDLFQFYAQPQRYFVDKHLQLRLQNNQEIAKDTEVFDLDSLESFSVNQEWLGRHFDSAEQESVNLEYLKRIRAEGRWPPGPLGDKLFSEMGEELTGFALKVRELKMGAKLDDPIVHFDLGEGKTRYRLRGKLHYAYDNGNLLYRYSKCKAEDQLTAWLNHLICLNNPDKLSADTTYLMRKDGFWRFDEVHDAQHQLIVLLDEYRQAQSSLSQLIAPAALAWAEFEMKPLPKKTSEQVTLDAFNKVLAYNNYWQLLYRNGTPELLFESDAFKAVSSLIVKPLVKSRNVVSYDPKPE